MKSIVGDYRSRSGTHSRSKVARPTCEFSLLENRISALNSRRISAAGNGGCYVQCDGEIASRL